MPVPGLPEYLDSPIGFIQWQVMRGMSLDDAEALAKTKRDYSHITSQQWQAVVDVARQNVNASFAAQNANKDTVFRQKELGMLSGIETIGLRVVVEIKFPDGHVEEASVLVNVLGRATKSDVEALVRGFVDTGGMSSRARAKGGRSYPVVVTDVLHWIVVIGGVDDPAITI